MNGAPARSRCSAYRLPAEHRPRLKIAPFSEVVFVFVSGVWNPVDQLRSWLGTLPWLLGAVARAVIELLSGAEAERLQICAAPSCGIFYPGSQALVLLGLREQGPGLTSLAPPPRCRNGRSGLAARRPGR
ncbi:MAG: hypothetical protein ACHQCF_06450 [Solirubrobacterales bacterium]